jgi:hypothetical protein
MQCINIGAACTGIIWSLIVRKVVEISAICAYNAHINWRYLNEIERIVRCAQKAC